MNTTDLIAGLFGAVILGLLVGYILYRFKVIMHRRKVLNNVIKNLEKQEKRNLDIAGVKVQNLSYVIDGKKIDPGKEAKIEMKEKELSDMKDKLKQISKKEKPKKKKK